MRSHLRGRARATSTALPLALVALTLAACGEATAPGQESAGPEGAFRSERLELAPGADQAPVVAVAGDDVLVVTADEDGALRSALSRSGAAFETGEPLATGLGHVQLGDAVRLADGDWLLLGSGGTVERDGDTELRFDAVAFRSGDGLTWEPTEVTGLAHPLDVNDVAVVGDTVVVAGSYRLAADPTMGGFEAHAWTSADGSAFTEVDLPDVVPPRGYRHESYAGSLAAVGDRLLAAGRVDGSAAVWVSDDAGRSWARSGDPELADVYALTGLATVGDVVLAGAGDAAATALRSTDGGRTWAPVDELAAGDEETAWAPVWSGGGRFWTLTGVDDMSWSRPEVCYADLSQCGRRREPQVVASTDGRRFTAIEVSGEIDEVVGTADGRALVLAAEGRGYVVHTLPAGVAPPTAAAPEQPRTVELVTPAAGRGPEVGVRYHAPLYLHCGMDWLWFGDATWRRTDGGADLETGAGDDPPEGWPVSGEALYGFATLTDADHLDYSIGSGSIGSGSIGSGSGDSGGDEVIATYVRDDEAPGCD